MSSGEDDDFDPATYAAMREKLLKKIIISENYFKEIRTLQKKRKKEELEEAKRQLANGTHPKLLEGIKQINAEADQARAISQMSYEIQHKAIERIKEANLYNINRQKEEDLAALQSRMREYLKERIAKKEMFQAGYEKTMWKLHKLHNQIEKEEDRKNIEVMCLDEDKEEVNQEDEVNVGASSSRHVEDSEAPEVVNEEISSPKLKKRKVREAPPVFVRNYFTRNLYF